MRTFYLILLGPVPDALWPNRARGRLWAYRKAAKRYRWEAKICALRELRGDRPRHTCPAFLRILFAKRRGKFPDADNVIAALKPAIDGIVDAGILADDRTIAGVPSVRFTRGGDGVLIGIEFSTAPTATGLSP
jgi:hypothetical protein